MRKSTVKRSQYSVSLISAISYDRIIANQLIECGVDSSVFESFLTQMLMGLSEDKDLVGSNVVVLMDNARVHHHELVLATARRFRVNILFSAQYSPWLNPVEEYFNFLKRSLKDKSPNSK